MMAIDRFQIIGGGGNDERTKVRNLRELFDEGTSTF